MSQDVEVFYDADGENRIFVFALPEATVTLKVQNTPEGAHQAELLVTNLPEILTQAMHGILEE